jgi:hypothetical protein
VTRILRIVLPAALLCGCAAYRAGAGASAAGEAAPAGAVALAVAPDRILAPLNRNVLSGFNFGNWVQVADFADDLRAVHPAELRFPGGEFGDANDLTEQALEAFQANLSLLGKPGTVIQTRVGWRSMTGKPHNQPEDAANAVRWAKARDIRVRYWEIGSEPDLFAIKQSDPDFTPEKYCQVFRAQAAAIKAADPAAKVAGPSVSGARPARDRYLERFVAACGDAVDVLTWHIYPSEGALSDEDAFATAREADDTAEAHRALWADPARNPKGHARKVDMAVTEWGLSSLSTRMRHLADMPAAMWTMEMAFRFDAQGLVSADYFCLQNQGGHGLLDQAGAPRPTYYAYALLAQLSGNLVGASTGDPDLWTHAARDGPRLDLVVTNRATQPKLLATEIGGFTLKSGTWFDEGIARDEKPPAAVEVGPTVKLPARSVVHLVYQKK